MKTSDRHALKAGKCITQENFFARPSKRFQMASAEGAGCCGAPSRNALDLLCPTAAGGRPGAVFRRTAPVFQRLESPAGFLKRFRLGQYVEAVGLSDIVFDPTDMEAMEQQLEELRSRHRDLDLAIEQLKAEGGDDIRIMGLKREKLRVKDSIVWLSSRITPDIIA